MIIRAPLRLRHGRVALPKPTTPFRPSRRFNSSLETDAASSGVVGVPTFINPSQAAQQKIAAADNLPAVAINDPNHPVAVDYAFFQHQKSKLQGTGSALSPHYKPYQLLSNPPYPRDITLELLIASQAHLGHATSLWNPANSRYIFGVRDGVHIISPDVTASHLRRACKIVSGVTERGGLVLFVGTREGHARAVVKAAQLAKGCHLFTKWIPGSITNGQQILGGCAKKVVNEFDQEVEGFEDQLGTKAALKPDLVVCLNPLENYVLLHECGLNNIPTIGIIDTDANPTWVTYPIPANDDSLRCVQVVAGALGRAGQEGQETRATLAKKGIVLNLATHGLQPPAQQPRSGVQSRGDRQRRQPRIEATAAAVEATAEPTLDEPDFDEDLVGISAEQHEEDQRILDQAEQVLTGESFESAVTKPEQSEDTLITGEEKADQEEESESSHLYANPNEELNSIDQSLVNEDFPSSASTSDEYDPSEDFAQFQGQIEADRERIAFESKQEEQGGVMDQVDDVAEELGESQGQAQTDAVVEAKDNETKPQPEEDPAVDAARLKTPEPAKKRK